MNHRSNLRTTARRAALATLAGLSLGILLPAPASSAAAMTDVPVIGSGTGTNVTTFGDPSTFVAEEVGHLSHLGVTVVRIQGTSALTASGIDLAGTATIVSASGDELWLSLSGAGVFTPTGGIQASVTGEVTGGTGRFDDASGTIVDDVILTITAASPSGVVASVSSSFSGSISY